MKISLSGRAAIVTGGSKGIGFAVATRFAASGADVAIVARTGEALREAVAAIRKSTQTRVIGVQADVSKAADVQRAYDEVMKAFDKVDIIVNNAGTSRAMPFDKLTDETLHDDLELKLFAAVRLIRLAAPQMKERRWGRIINVLNIRANQHVQTAKRANMTLEDYYKTHAKEIPIARFGEAEEFANLACFLVSDQGSYITGTAINVDGGRSPVV